MRRADYLLLAEVIRAEVERQPIHATTDPQSHRSGRLASVRLLAHDFSRRAHLGGMTRAEFLKLAGVSD